VAAYEAGIRKIPASLLPVLSKMFAVPVEQLLGMSNKPAKRGPASILQRQLEQVNNLPRSKQKIYYRDVRRCYSTASEGAVIEPRSTGLSMSLVYSLIQ